MPLRKSTVTRGGFCSRPKKRGGIVVMPALKVPPVRPGERAGNRDEGVDWVGWHGLTWASYGGTSYLAATVYQASQRTNLLTTQNFSSCLDAEYSKAGEQHGSDTFNTIRFQ